MWERFTFGNAQIAVKIRAHEEADSDIIGFDRLPFVLPSTSRRDPSLRAINIWTSRNIAAQLRHPESFATGLREGSRQCFEFLSNHFEIEFDPTRDARGVEWQHRE